MFSVFTEGVDVKKNFFGGGEICDSMSSWISSSWGFDTSFVAYCCTMRGNDEFLVGDEVY